MFAMSLNKSHDLIDLHAAEPPGTLKDNGIKPKLGDHALTFNMDMRRFASIQRDEEKPVSIMSQKDRKSTRLNSSHLKLSRMPSSA